MTILKLDHSRGGWTAIPRAAAEDERLSLEARGLLIWLLVKPPNWEVRVEYVKAHLRLGNDKWTRVARELKAAGYYTVRIVRSERGRIRSVITVTPTPLSLEEKRSPPPGISGGGDRPLDQPWGGAVGGLTGDGIQKYKKIDEEDNNNRSAQSGEQGGVVFEDDLFGLGLLTNLEKEQVLRAIQGHPHAQMLADELAGALRIHGRGHKGIKHPARWLTSCLNVPREDLLVSQNEQELRQLRTKSRERAASFIYPSPPSPPSKEIREKLANLRASFNSRKGKL